MLGFGLAGALRCELSMGWWPGHGTCWPGFGQAAARYGVLLVRAGPGRWWAPLVLASEWTAGQLRPGPEFVRRPRRLGLDLAATLLEWECPHQALQGAPASQQGD